MVGSHRVLHDNAWISIGGALASVIPSPAELPPLTRNFYDREVTQVAIELLGKLLLRSLPEGIAGGIIVEVEAYLARNDPANHAYRGCTIRNRSMFGPPGHAYVYRIHQQHCLNVVTEPPSTPSAVLIRAIQPVWGVELMERRRHKNDIHHLTNGPGKLCQALAIDLQLDGWDLTRGERLWLTAVEGEAPFDFAIAVSERIGVTTAKDKLLRFFINDNPFVGTPRRARKLIRHTSSDGSMMLRW